MIIINELATVTIFTTNLLQFEYQIFSKFIVLLLHSVVRLVICSENLIIIFNIQ